MRAPTVATALAIFQIFCQSIGEKFATVLDRVAAPSRLLVDKLLVNRGNQK
jgi:hypothetical protein